MHSRWREINKIKDTKGLINVIKSYCYHSSSNHYLCVSVLRARIELYNYQQCKDQSVQGYIKELNDLHDVVKVVNKGKGVSVDGKVFEEVERLFQRQYESLPIDPSLLDQYNRELLDYSDKLMLAIIALRVVSPSKYKLLKAELQNQYNLG